ncbi:hypothetical protein CQ046_03260 [Chryseobacterium sp. MYb7]|uniref:toll/interleukin-1 receptor domain-containing protein n=1 Tax=Chryseobacterium sp. MYb7 TaxID=1827290 RepID=UPI000D00B530|nr:toll/interleukin-1 receptor domain-containing protein [Chryseobacterium sp. MYb7]PRB06201.1 hypothetical protein CQ046_03260 [Chryseobacterium sp. MYb7]
MSIKQYSDKVIRIEKEISDIQKKIAIENKKEFDKQKDIDTINRSITKSTSIASLQNKQKQIQSHQTYILKVQNTKSDLYKKIATKTADLVKAKQELSKEELKEKNKSKRDQEEFQKKQILFQREQTNFQHEQEKLQLKLQTDISNQKEVLNTIVNQIHSTKNENNTNENKEYDFFISHATEDKETFVQPLAEVLQRENINIWYDKFQMKIGDSLRKRIDEGLKSSKYGIVVLSRDFFKKNWTEYELNGLVAREMNGIKVILPIWHNVTKNEVLSFSPSLADKVALNTAIYSIEEIANELKRLIE